MFAITRFRYIEGISSIFYHYRGEEYRSLYRGLCYMGVRYLPCCRESTVLV